MSRYSRTLCLLLSAMVGGFAFHADAQGAPEQAHAGFLALKVRGAAVKGYTTITSFKDDFDVLALSASPSTVNGGAVTIQATLTLDGVPLIFQALQRADPISFDLTFTQSAKTSEVPFAVLKADRALITAFSLVAISGKPLQAQVTLTASSAKLVSPTGAVLSTLIPAITLPRVASTAATTVRGNPIASQVAGVIAHSDSPSIGATAGIALDTLIFRVAHAAGASFSTFSRLHFTTHAENALDVLTHAATRGDQMRALFQFYEPASPGRTANQPMLIIRVNSATFPALTASAGMASAGTATARTTGTTVTPGSYDLELPANAASVTHVLEISQPAHSLQVYIP